MYTIELDGVDKYMVIEIISHNRVSQIGLKKIMIMRDDNMKRSV